MFNREKLQEIIDLFLKENSNLEIIAISTGDGFPVALSTKEENEIEPDKMAAAASTLYSVSNAVSMQLLSRRFEATIIESNNGNIAFVALEFLDNDFVMAMSANAQLNLASLRILIKRLTVEIKKL